ncbi:MAG: hypothetical protein J0H38_01065 [Rhizobiales bacterium]|nr:hypothetical protein [Hyphomicrobiales bacterium]
MNETAEYQVEADNADTVAWSWSPPETLPDHRELADKASIAALDPKQWQPAKQLAFELGVAVQTLRDRARFGHIEKTRVGGRVLIHAPSARRHHALLHGHREPSR